MYVCVCVRVFVCVCVFVCVFMCIYNQDGVYDKIV